MAHGSIIPNISCELEAFKGCRGVSAPLIWSCVCLSYRSSPKFLAYWGYFPFLSPDTGFLRLFPYFSGYFNETWKGQTLPRWTKFLFLKFDYALFPLKGNSTTHWVVTLTSSWFVKCFWSLEYKWWYKPFLFHGHFKAHMRRIHLWICGLRLPYLHVFTRFKRFHLQIPAVRWQSRQDLWTGIISAVLNMTYRCSLKNSDTDRN